LRARRISEKSLPRKSNNERFKGQLDYLLHHSDCDKTKLAAAGTTRAQDINGLEDIAQLPFTKEDEI